MLIPKDTETHKVVRLMLQKFIKDISKVPQAHARDKLDQMAFSLLTSFEQFQLQQTLTKEEEEQGTSHNSKDNTVVLTV